MIYYYNNKGPGGSMLALGGPDYNRIHAFNMHTILQLYRSWYTCSNICLILLKYLHYVCLNNTRLYKYAITFHLWPICWSVLPKRSHISFKRYWLVRTCVAGVCESARASVKHQRERDYATTIKVLLWCIGCQINRLDRVHDEPFVVANNSFYSGRVERAYLQLGSGVCHDILCATLHVECVMMRRGCVTVLLLHFVEF